MPTLAEMLRQGSWNNPQNPYSSNLLADALRGSLSNAESLGRGAAVAPLGIFGDVNALAREYITPRLPAKVQAALESLPSAPTTEAILAQIPRGTEARRESSGMEQLGAAMNPMGPIEAAKGVTKGLGAYGKLAGEAVNDAMVYGRGPLAEITPQPMRMDVWHGSPNGPFTKFDPSKARTGEGNASYGEGAYLAQARGTGEEYRKALTGNHNSDQFIPTVDGKPTDSFVAKAIIREGGNPQPFIAKMQSKLEKQLVGLEKASKEDDLGLGITDYDMALMDVDKTKKIIDEAASYIGKTVKNEQPGYLYKVDLPDESIAKMIDWDKPIGQQSKEVQQAIEKTKSMLPPNAIDDLGGDLSLLYGKDVTPEQFLNTWESFGQKAGGENALAQHGVTGVRYLDQESRNAGQFSITPPTHTVSGKWMVKGTDYNSKGMQFDTEKEALAKLQEMNANQTSNFVVFPQYQDLLKIKEINDKPLGAYK